MSRIPLSVVRLFGTAALLGQERIGPEVGLPELVDGGGRVGELVGRLQDDEAADVTRPRALKSP